MGTVILIYGLSKYAIRKGRDWRWGLIGLLSYFGGLIGLTLSLIIFYFLKDLTDKQLHDNSQQATPVITQNNAIPPSSSSQLSKPLKIILGVATFWPIFCIGTAYTVPNKLDNLIRYKIYGKQRKNTTGTSGGI